MDDPNDDKNNSNVASPPLNSLTPLKTKDDEKEKIESCYLVVDLFHKQRGGKGTWYNIEEGTLIRVTKNVGKKIKLVIKAVFKFDRENVVLQLIDYIHPEQSTIQEGRYSIENVLIKDNDYDGTNAEFELKIYTLSKELEFNVHVSCLTGTFNAKSECFGTHNSGKLIKKVDNLTQKTKKILVPLPSSLKRKHDNEIQNPNKKLKRETNPKDEHTSDFSVQELLNALSLIQLKYNFILEIGKIVDMEDPTLSSNFNYFAKEAQRKYPEAVMIIGHNQVDNTRKEPIYGIYYSDILPIILFELNLYEELNIDPLIFDVFQNYKYSSTAIENDIKKNLSHILSKIQGKTITKYPTTQSVNNGYYPLYSSPQPPVEPPLTKYSPVPKMEGINEHMNNIKLYLERVIYEESKKRRFDIGLLMYCPQFKIEENIYPVLYKNNKLFTDKSVFLNGDCKFIAITAENESYIGTYSVVLYTKSSFNFEGRSFLMLVDNRGGKNYFSIQLIVNLSMVFQDLWIIGRVIVNETNSVLHTAINFSSPKHPNPREHHNPYTNHYVHNERRNYYDKGEEVYTPNIDPRINPRVREYGYPRGNMEIKHPFSVYNTFEGYDNYQPNELRDIRYDNIK